MVMKDLNCWAKCCFEPTDFGTHAPVGNGGIRVYENLAVENKTVKNIRVGK